MIIAFDSRYTTRATGIWGDCAGFVRMTYMNARYACPGYALNRPIMLLAHANDLKRHHINVADFIAGCQAALYNPADIVFLFFSGGGGANEILRLSNLLPGIGRPNVYYYEGRFEDCDEDVAAFVERIKIFHAKYLETGEPDWNVFIEETWEARARRFALEVASRIHDCRAYLGTFMVYETPFYEFRITRATHFFGDQADAASGIADALAAYYQTPSDAAAREVQESCRTYLASVAGYANECR